MVSFVVIAGVSRFEGSLGRGGLVRLASNSTVTGAAPVSPALVGLVPAHRDVDQFFQDSHVISAGLRPAGFNQLSPSEGTYLPTSSAKNHLPTTSAENLVS